MDHKQAAPSNGIPAETEAQKRIPSSPPPVPALPPGVTRPLWSVMMPVYNGGAYFEEALRSVLQQDPGTEVMQIMVVDDASTDIDLRALIRGLAGERVEYLRQEHNVGSVRNFNTCLERARGHLVHLLHADDRVLPGFYDAMQGLFEANPSAGACFAHHRYINASGRTRGQERIEAPSDGVIEGWLERIATRQTMQYVAVAVRRSVYEEVGGFFGVVSGEDWEMWARIASRHPMAYTPRTLAEYRIHDDSISARGTLTAQNMKDWIQVMKTIQGHLPKADRKRVWKASVKAVAHDGLMYARQLWRRDGNRHAARLWIRESIRLHMDPELLWKAAELHRKMWLNVRS